MTVTARHSTLHGLWPIIRLNLRVDRVRALSWVIGITALVGFSGASVMSLYSSPDQIATYVALIDISPNMVAVNRALNGPGFGFDDPNVGVVLVNELAVWGAVGFALMSVFLTSRHTRADEDAERTELLRSRMVGRHTVVAAAVLTVSGLELIAAAAAFVCLLALGFAPVGSAALVLAWLSTGLALTAVTALAAQVAGTARATIGLGVGAAGAAYLVRAIGDMGSGTLSWLSPMGWVHRVRPFAGEQWWVLLLPVGVAAVATAGAIVLSDRRNLGSGLRSQRLGPERAGRITVHPTGLVARLQAGTIVGWMIGLCILGMAYGLIASDVEQMFAANPDMERFIPVGGGSVTDMYLAYTLALSTMLVGGFVTGSVLRLRSEEADGRLELVLARPMARTRWLGDHLLVALGGSVAAVVASGTGTGIGVAWALDDPAQVPRMLGAALALLPVVLVLMGFTTLCIGLVPKVAPVAWLGLALVVTIGLLGDLLRLSDWIRRISPLEHLPATPAAAFDLRAFLAVSAVGLALTALGLVGFRRRDIPAL